MGVPITVGPDARPVRRASGIIGTLSRTLNGDRLAYGLVFCCAACIILLTVLLAYELWTNSALSRMQFGWRFLYSSTWDPIAGKFGALPFIYGTVITTFLGLLLAIPLGIGAAVFLAELARPRISDLMTFLIELLAAVPSVIIGLIGIFVLIPILQKIVPTLKSVLGFLPIFSGPFYGVSIFSAGIVLAFMILPFIISISREVLLAVPRDLREAALALGATKWESNVAGCYPICAHGNYRLDIPCHGPGAGRNNGCNHGHWKQPEDNGLTAGTWLFDCFRHCQ